MITVGIDVGAKTTKIVLLNESKILSDFFVIGEEVEKSVDRGLKDVIRKGGVSDGEIKYKVVTGINRYLLKDVDELITDVVCHAKGAIYYFPKARTVIDIGCDGSRAARIDERGG